MGYKDKIYDILDKKFSSHKGYISLKELDLNANYDDRFGKWTETNIIGFVYRSKKLMIMLSILFLVNWF